MSWIIKSKFDGDTLEFTLVDPSEESILIEKESICSITEFVKGCMMIHVFNLDLLVIKDWEVIHRISDPDTGNIEKFQHLPLYDFDIDKYPFVLTSSYKSMSLVNIATGEI